MEGKSYQGVSCSLCFFIELFDEDAVPESTWEYTSSWCSLFKRIWRSGGFFLGLEIFSIVSAVVLIALLVLFFFNYFYWRASYIAGGCLWASHTVATVIWVASVKFTFGDDCEDLTDGEEAPRVCARDGPKLGIFTMLFLPFAMIPFFLVVCYMERKQKAVKEIVEAIPPESPGTKKERNIQEVDDLTLANYIEKRETKESKKSKKKERKEKKKKKEQREKYEENYENDPED